MYGSIARPRCTVRGPVIFAYRRKGTRVNLKQLRYFVTAVDLSNITRAAKKLHVAQPALGMHIRELETELGVQLLIRHSRGVDPTPAGQLLYSRASIIFEQLEQTRNDVIQLHHAARRSLTLGLTTSLTLLVGTDVQLMSERDFDNLSLGILEGPSFSLIDAIEREEVDVALAYDIGPRPNLTLSPVLEEEILFVTADPSAYPGDSVSLDEVLSAKLALGTKRDIGRRVLAAAAGVTPETLGIAYEVQSITAIRDLILRGEACSVMPYGTVARELAQGRLVARRVTGTPLKSTLYIARRSNQTFCEAPGFREAIDRLLARVIDMLDERLGLYAVRFADTA